MEFPSSSPASRINDYVMLENIGHGSYSTVYKGYDKKHSGTKHRNVALKVIGKAAIKEKSKHAQVYLRREIEIMKRLHHENIVQLIEVIDDDKNLYLVMEFCEGGTLAQLLEQHNHLPEEMVLRFLSQLASGLKYMYNKNIIHRDLKPHNLLLTSQDINATIKICDYGFARTFEKTAMMDSILGSPLYMAPEILRQEKYTNKCDLWSVGIIMYEMLTGVLPFNPQSPLELFRMHQEMLRVPTLNLPTFIESSLSEPCKNLLQSLLKVDPKERITWPDFFLHPFFNPKPVHIPPPPSPNLSCTKVEGRVTVYSFQKGARFEVDLCSGAEVLVTAFKSDVAKQLQIQTSPTSTRNLTLLLHHLASQSTVEMEDDHLLSKYVPAIKSGGELYVVDKTAPITTEDIPAAEDHILDISDIAAHLQPSEVLDVQSIRSHFQKFVEKQSAFHEISKAKYTLCKKHYQKRTMLLHTFKFAISTLRSALTAINEVISPSRSLFDNQQGKLMKMEGGFENVVKEMKDIVVSESLIKMREGTGRLVDCVGGQEEVVKLMELCKENAGKLLQAVTEIDSLSATAQTEVNRNFLSYDDDIDSLQRLMDESMYKIEAIKLFLDHTDKWKAASENQISDLEWEFVLDEYQQVHTSCAEDIRKAQEYAKRVMDIWLQSEKQTSYWNELAERLNLILDYRSQLLKAIRVQIPVVAQQVLDHQSQLDRMEAVMGLPNMYKQYIKVANSRGSFERFTARVVEHFESKREVAQVKLASFQETYADNPLKHIFSTPIVNPSTLVSLHVVPADLEFAGFVGDEEDDEDFNIIVSEDTTSVVRENAKLLAQLNQLVESKKRQENKQEQLQPLLHLLDAKQKKREQASSVAGNNNDTEDEKMMQFVAVESEKLLANEIKRLTELLEAKNVELDEQKAQNNKMAVNLKEREQEKEREINEYSAKLAQSVEFLEARARNLQAEYESKLNNKDQEILLLKQQLQFQAVTQQQETELKRFQQSTSVRDKTLQDFQEEVKALQNYKAKSQESERQLVQLQEQLESKEKLVVLLRATAEQHQKQEEDHLKEIESLKSTIGEIQQALDNNERNTQELEGRLQLLLGMIPGETIRMLNFGSVNRQ